MHFDYFCLFVLNCFAQFSCFELMIDSEIIHGVREPDGFTRQNLTCPEGNKILILSVRFGYKVRWREVCDVYNCLCCGQAEEEIGDCAGPDSSLSSCVVNLSTGPLQCTAHWCRFPSKHDWDAAQFVAGDDPLCGDTITLKYWHICYDCLLGADPGQILVL